MVATTPTASRRIEEVWSPEYSPEALPSRWRAAPAKKSMLSTLPGTSNSVASRTGLPVWLTSSATRSAVASSASLASLASTADRSAGVAVDHPRRAARAELTAASTSAGCASWYSATGLPVAGLTTAWVGPPVDTGAPSIQLPANTGGDETAVMRPTLSRPPQPGLRITAASTGLHA